MSQTQSSLAWNRKFHLTTGIAICFAFIYCYSGVFMELVQKWKRDDMYSFGVLIPVISAYLIWLKRDDLNAIFKKPDKVVGFVVLVAGLVVLLVGKIISIVVIQELSLIVSITGIVLIMFGRNTFLLIWFPILYLIFMIPFWNHILDPLHFPFQIISATLGVKLVNVLGIPVFRSAQFIELPNITLEVAELCSGVNYLISIVAIGIPMCYLYLHRWSKRILLILFAVLVAMLSNSLRVAGVAIFTYYGGVTSPENIHGPFDIFRSLIISIVGVLVLCLGVICLKDDNKKDLKSIEKKSDHAYNVIGANTRENIPSFPILPTIAFFLIIVAGYKNHSYEPKPVPLKMSFHNFPITVKGWTGGGSEASIPIVNFKEMGVNNELSRSYINNNGRNFNLYVGYFDYQNQEKELISNKLDALYKHSEKYNMNLPSYRMQEVNIYYNSKSVENNFIVHWLDINGIKTDNRIKAKGYILKNSILHSRSNAAIVMISTTIDQRDDKNKVVLECKEFINTMYPLLYNHIPQI